MTSTVIAFTPPQKEVTDQNIHEVASVADPRSAAACHLGPYLALVMAFVASADAEVAVQKQAGGSLAVQEQRISEVQAQQNALCTSTVTEESAVNIDQLTESAYMQLANTESQAIDAKTSVIDMNIQTIVKQQVDNSSQREETALQGGSGIIQALESLRKG